MHLYLVQHGRSKSGEVDTERRLTERGRADVEKVAALIKSFKLHIDSIWHSGKARAAETADILLLPLDHLLSSNAPVWLQTIRLILYEKN